MNKSAETKISSALIKNYTRYDVEFTGGKGAYLYDSTGKKYLDFLSGIAVTGFGHCHPKITEAVEMQLHSYWHISNLFASPGQELLAKKLSKITGLDKAFFCNSGTEANEAAIKFARLFNKDKFKIISAIGSFHGRTLGSLSATGQYSLWKDFKPLVPGFTYVPYDNPIAIEHSIDEYTAAVMLEPIQGESGVVVPSAGYLRKVKEICERNDVLLILDEVQTGIGRTGKYFASQWEDIVPDMITFAKGIANGIPLGGIIVSDKVAEFITPGSHGSTFGGNPLAVAAANQVLDLLNSDTLNDIQLAGTGLKETLNILSSGFIKEIRGKGLMTGVELIPEISAKKTAKELLANGFITGTSGDSVLRLLPPFIITDKEIKDFAEGLSFILQPENFEKLKK